jgi:hypothetical protein
MTATLPIYDIGTVRAAFRDGPLRQCGVAGHDANDCL